MPCCAAGMLVPLLFLTHAANAIEWIMIPPGIQKTHFRKFYSLADCTGCLCRRFPKPQFYGNIDSGSTVRHFSRVLENCIVSSQLIVGLATRPTPRDPQLLNSKNIGHADNKRPSSHCDIPALVDIWNIFFFIFLALISFDLSLWYIIGIPGIR